MIKIEVKTMRNMFEVIQISMREWSKPEYRGIEFGKVVVLIADKELGMCAMTVQNFLPIPKLIGFKEEYDEGLSRLINCIEMAGAKPVVLKQRLYTSI